MSNPLWGRKYQVLVVLKDGTTALDVANSSFEPEALRVKFRIEQCLYAKDSWKTYGEIEIYNLTSATEQQLITEGSKVIVQAGYMNGEYGKIFDGRVYQPFRDRENVVDYKLVLNCVHTMNIVDNLNFVSFTAAGGQDQRGQIRNICSQSRIPIQIGHITEDLDSSVLPRGKVYFGEPSQYFRDIARHNNAHCWASEDQVQFSKITDVPTGEALVLTPSTGLIGTPCQTDYGVSFRALLDPRIKLTNPQMMVKLDMSMIRQTKRREGIPESTLDQDGIYKVIGVTYLGDTRGNEWYVDVVGVSSKGKINRQLADQNRDNPDMLQGNQKDLD